MRYIAVGPCPTRRGASAGSVARGAAAREAACAGRKVAIFSISYSLCRRSRIDSRWPPVVTRMVLLGAVALYSVPRHERERWGGRGNYFRIHTHPSSPDFGPASLLIVRKRLPEALGWTASEARLRSLLKGGCKSAGVVDKWRRRSRYIRYRSTAAEERG